MKKIFSIKHNFLFLLFTLLLTLSFRFQKKLTIFLVGDSTMANKTIDDEPEKGWGQAFAEFFSDNLVVENHAQNGRSSKSFIQEGLWNKVIDRINPGDYVLIQFGHNDSKITDTSRYAEANSTFRKNLIKMVGDVFKMKGNPVLITPVNRRKFDESGTFIDQHGDYPKAVREIALEMNLPLIDLHDLSFQLLSKLGAEESKKIFLHVKSGMYKKYPDGKEDDTHFNEYGARVVAGLVVSSIKKQNLKLSDFFIDR